jgi:hypothetical protein
MVEKHARDPQVILKWSLNFFQNILKIIWGLFSKKRKRFNKENCRVYFPNMLLLKN